MGRTAKLHIYSPYERLEELMRPWLSYFCAEMTYEVVFHAVDPKVAAVVYEDRTLTVETIPLRHRVPCCGYLFREHAPRPHIRRDMIDFLGVPFHAINTIKAGADWVDANGKVWENSKLVIPHEEKARAYAYCSDTLYRPSLVDQLKGVDLLFHEATFADAERKRAKETGHSTSVQAAKIAVDSHVKRLVIGHFSARYENETVLLEEAQRIFPNSIAATEGMKISL